MRGWALLCLFLTAPVFGCRTASNASLHETRIALLSDTHVNRSTNGEPALYRARLERAIEQVNEARVNLILIAGDLTEDGAPDQISDFKEIIRKFKAPVLFVPGNHDIGNKIGAGQAKTVTAEKVTTYERALGASFFSRSLSGIRVVGINSSILGSGFPIEEKMWAFLESELAASDATPTLLFCHYPPFIKEADEKGGDYFNMEKAPRRRLLDLLGRGGIRLVLTGHLHRDLINRAEGITFITTRPVSFGLPKGKQPEGWTLITLRPGSEPIIESKIL